MESKKERLGLELIKAAKRGDVESVKSLIKEGADVNFKDGNGQTALMLAAYYGGGEIESIMVLVDAGADVNLRDKYGYTALMHAAYEGYVEIAKYLIDNGAV